MSALGVVNGSVSRTVLCVDPSSTMSQTQRDLQAMGWEVTIAQSVAEATSDLQEGDHDLGIINLEDIGDAEEILAADPLVQWIAIVSDESLMDEDVQRLLSHHFYDYHRLPVDSQRLAATLGHASGLARLRRLHNERTAREYEFENGFIGKSPAIIEIRKQVARVAKEDFPVLIHGESGTGKELIARAIHDQSNRSKGPFVAVNCGALPSSLIQSELFGHEKGAFTGADKRRLGRFEVASGGTLFLDEIGDLSVDMQVNLLRVLEQGVIERVGDNESRPIDTRIVAATNTDLREAVKAKLFREDLFYRINVFELNIPPLRDRGDDLFELAETFVARLNNGAPAKGISKRAISAMRAYTWPGNVRELINRIQQAQISCEANFIMPRDLGLESIEDENVAAGQTLEDARNEAEKNVLVSALWRHTNNVSRVARDLAVSRVTLYRLLKKHNLEPALNRH